MTLQIKSHLKIYKKGLQGHLFNRVSLTFSHVRINLAQFDYVGITSIPIDLS